MDMVNILEKFKFILSNLTTENIIKKFSFLNPHVFITDWRLMGLFVVIVVFLLSFRMIKTLTFLLGSIILWIIGYYYLPKIETGIELGNIIIVIISSLLVVGMWIYVFFIRE